MEPMRGDFRASAPCLALEHGGPQALQGRFKVKKPCRFAGAAIR
jgi:hypothetical protein